MYILFFVYAQSLLSSASFVPFPVPIPSLSFQFSFSCFLASLIALFVNSSFSVFICRSLFSILRRFAILSKCNSSCFAPSQRDLSFENSLRLQLFSRQMSRVLPMPFCLKKGLLRDGKRTIQSMGFQLLD